MQPIHPGLKYQAAKNSIITRSNVVVELVHQFFQLRASMFPMFMLWLALLFGSWSVDAHAGHCHGEFTKEICKFLCGKLPVMPESCKDCYTCPPLIESRRRVTPICIDATGGTRRLYEYWYDNQDHPCILFTCTATGVQEQRLDTSCPDPPPDNINCTRYRNIGECCYSYNCTSSGDDTAVQNCIDSENNLRRHGERWADPDDACLILICNNGTQEIVYNMRSSCLPPPRPPLVCSPYQEPSECCPSYNCSIVSGGGRPCHDPLSGEIIQHGDHVYDDETYPCERRLCVDSKLRTIIDKRLSCYAQPIDGCSAYRSVGECCYTYKCGCTFNGVNYQNGETFPDNVLHPCMIMKCQDNSIVVIHKEECDDSQLTCANPTWPIGQCCRQCDFCTFNGVDYDVGEVFFDDPNRPCVEYICNESLQVVELSREECAPSPAINCTPIFTEGVCCPRWDCPDETTTCQFGGANYSVGDEFYDDADRPCVRYRCGENGVAVVHITECPFAPHQSCSPWFRPGVCCPRWDCPNGGCLFNGREYDHGVVWPDDVDRPCLWLGCNNSQVYEHSRHPPCPSPPASHCISRLVQGQCCPSYDCRNVTCLYNGVDYPLGAIFNDDNLHPCKTFNCTKQGPVKIGDLSTQCPPLNPPNCTQIRRPGECCKECDTSAVVEECVDSLGNTHQDGTIFLYDEDACILVECDNGTIQLVLNRSDNCSPPPSNPNCTINPDSEDKCCPDYICPPCRYNGVEYPPGVKFWDDPDRQCHRFMCMPDGSVVTVLDNLPCPTVRAGCVAQYVQPQCCHYKYTCMFDPQHNLIPMT